MTYFAQFAINKELQEGTSVWTREAATPEEHAQAFIAVFANDDPHALMRDMDSLGNEVHNLLVGLRKQVKSMEDGEDVLVEPSDAKVSGSDDARNDTNDDVPTS